MALLQSLPGLCGQLILYCWRQTLTFERNPPGTFKFPHCQIAIDSYNHRGLVVTGWPATLPLPENFVSLMHPSPESSIFLSCQTCAKAWICRSLCRGQLCPLKPESSRVLTDRFTLSTLLRQLEIYPWGLGSVEILDM